VSDERIVIHDVSMCHCEIMCVDCGVSIVYYRTIRRNVQEISLELRD